MFERVKEAFGGKHTNRVEEANQYDWKDKIFTKSLVLRASQYQDEAEQDLINMLGHIKPYIRGTTLNDLAESGAITISYQITTSAMEEIGRNPAFLPGSTLPKDAH